MPGRPSWRTPTMRSWGTWVRWSRPWWPPSGPAPRPGDPRPLRRAARTPRLAAVERPPLVRPAPHPTSRSLICLDRNMPDTACLLGDHGFRSAGGAPAAADPRPRAWRRVLRERAGRPAGDEPARRLQAPAGAQGSRPGPGAGGRAAPALPAQPGATARTRPVAGSLPRGLGRQPGQAGTAPGPDGPGRDRGRAMTAGKLEDIGGGQWRLRFTRDLAHPQDKVWRAITEPDHMQAWFPQHVSGDWVVGGPLTFSSPEQRGPDFTGEVLAYQPQSLVEFRWGTDVIRLELAGRPGGCTLTLLDTFSELGKAARDAAGWHECLDRLTDDLDKGEMSFTPGQRWAEVHPRYVEEFGPEAAAIGPPAGY